MDARRTWPAVLGALIRGEHLTADEAAWAMNEIMEGAATPAQIAGFGVALRIKGETAVEVTGLAEAMLTHATPVSIPGRTVDLVGTGADGARTVNVSTMGTIAAAAAGARMVKHGNRAASSACGTADVLEALGVVIDLPPAATEQLVNEVGVPTVFNVLGPVANPARPAAQALGVADVRMGPILAGVLAARGCSGLVFHGGDGLDELTTTAPSDVWIVHDGTVTETRFDPAELGIARAVPADLVGGDPAHNAGVVRAFVEGSPGPVRDIALLNAGAALAAEGGVAGPGELVAALSEGYRRAAAAVDSGAAADLLDRWVQVSKRLATG
jgi:anthranilate phosphoribosyltransferase